MMRVVAVAVLIVMGLSGTVYTGYVESQMLPEAPPAIEAPTYTPETLQKVARVVMAETRGDTLENMRGVAQVIYERHKLWNRSVNYILNSPAQFASPYEGDVTEECQQVVNEVFLEGVKEFDSNVTHFYNPEMCSPDWASTKEVVGSRGKHVFLY